MQWNIGLRLTNWTILAFSPTNFLLFYLNKSLLFTNQWIAFRRKWFINKRKLWKLIAFHYLVRRSASRSSFNNTILTYLRPPHYVWILKSRKVNRWRNWRTAEPPELLPVRADSKHTCIGPAPRRGWHRSHGFVNHLMIKTADLITIQYHDINNVAGSRERCISMIQKIPLLPFLTWNRQQGSHGNRARPFSDLL